MTTSPKPTAYLAAIILALGAACGNADLAAELPAYVPSASARNIFGADDRVPVTSRQYPWSTIGTFEGIGCTGTLVGPRWVITAAHCVLEGSTGRLHPSLSHFLISYVAGQPAARARITNVWYGTTDPDAARHQDWAVVELGEDLGNRFGWLGVRDLDLQWYPQYLVHMAGYSADYEQGSTATASLNCLIRDTQTYAGIFLHDCETTRGSSGAAMFEVSPRGEYLVVALNVAEFREGGDTSLRVPVYSEEHANVAISILEPLTLLGRLWAQVR